MRICKIGHEGACYHPHLVIGESDTPPILRPNSNRESRSERVMRAVAPIAAAISLALLVSSVPTALRPRNALAADTTIVAQISPSTKALDLGNGVAPPIGSDVARFDDSSWDNANLVSSEAARCMHIGFPNLPRMQFYWGATTPHTYLFRIKFTVPWAGSYAGSTVSYVANALAYELGFDGSPLRFKPLLPGVRQPVGLQTFPVESYVQPGPNVVTFWADPPRLCLPAVSIRVVIHAHGVSGGPVVPNPSVPTVMPAFPPDNAIVTGSSLPLSWQPFPQAAAYLVRLWLVKADAGQVVIASTVATTARTVLGVRMGLSTVRMLKGQYRWDIAALNAAGQLITAWSMPRRLQLE